MIKKSTLKMIFLVITLSNSLAISFFSFNNTNLATAIPESPISSTDAQYDCVDAWIIVGGDRSDHEASELVLRTTEWVYDMALACGSSDSDIYYIVPEISEGDTNREDATTSRDNIQDAFTTWAPTKVGPNGVLGVYLHDHGGTNSMTIAPHGRYYATDLDDDLDAFEAASGCDRVIVIYEACSSGSFLDEVSQSDRIILTSSEPGYSAFWSPVSPHISMFGEALFNSMIIGNSIGDAFVDAQNEINALGYGDTQHPCIDDNHDGVGHIVNAWGQLPSTGDGYDAKNTYMCVNCPTDTFNMPTFLQIPLKTWIGYISPLILPISVKISNTTDIEKVFCRIVPEDWTPPAPLDNESMGGWDPEEDLFQFELTPEVKADGNFTGFVEVISPARYTDYALSFIVTDIDGKRGPIVTTRVELNDDGVAPADEVDPTVIILNPIDGEVVNETLMISVQGADDAGLDEIQIYIDGELNSTTKMPNYLPYPDIICELDTKSYENGALNITAKAIDKAGNSNSFSVNVIVNNTEDSFWDGLPFDLQTAAIIGGAGVVGVLGIGTMRYRAKRRKLKGATRRKVYPKKTQRKDHTKKTRAKPRGRVNHKLTSPKTSRADFAKKTRSKTSRTDFAKKTRAKSSRTDFAKKTSPKTSRADFAKKTRAKSSRTDFAKKTSPKTSRADFAKKTRSKTSRTSGKGSIKISVSKKRRGLFRKRTM